MAATVQDIQLATVHSVQTLPINPYPDSQAVAVDKSVAQVVIPALSEVQAVQPLSAAFGPYPSSQVVHSSSSQTVQLSPQSPQTLSAKY